MKYSLVIPVYNSESYLPDFLKSLEAFQGDFSFEIIFVLEPSSDNSIKLVEEYAKDKSFVKLIKNGERKGAFASRKIGIKESKGDYILFADSDDLLFPNYIESIEESLNLDADLIDFPFYIRRESKTKLVRRKKEKIISKEEAKKDILLDIHMRSFLWNKVFKGNILRSLIEEINLDFSLFEDQVLVFSYLDKCNKILLSNKPIYIYIEREDSLMGKSISRASSHLEAYKKISKIDKESFRRIFFRYFALFKIYIKYDIHKEKLDKNKSKMIKKALKEFKESLR
ncbi:MAG: glycosyltransferase family 2 protein [Bacilli bacterium]|nr:glycosyltransferase family 2 protein [Bacilli bacterium]MDY6430297.1 glycosyltransferase family 2 protein [Bacilli bacterium]